MTDLITTSHSRLQRLRDGIRAARRLARPQCELRRLVGDAANVPTFCSFRERLLLADETLDALHADRPARVVEVGAYLGASSCVLAEVIRRKCGGNGAVHCIDTWMNDAMADGRHDTFTAFQRHTAPWGEIVRMLRGRSDEVSLPDAPYDLVFIDGDHSYDGARADIQRFAPLVATHGRLVLHDHRTKAGVTRALGELLSTGDWVIGRCEQNIVSLRRRADGDTPSVPTPAPRQSAQPMGDDGGDETIDVFDREVARV